MIFPYQPHRYNERVVLVIHVYIQLKKTGLFSLHKGFSIVFFLFCFFVLFTIFDSIKYWVVKIYVLWRIIKVLFLYMFSFVTLWTFIYKFHTFVQQIGKHGLYILREACSLKVSDCSGREIVFFFHDEIAPQTSFTGSRWCDTEVHASSTLSCVTFGLITVTAGSLERRGWGAMEGSPFPPQCDLGVAEGLALI